MFLLIFLPAVKAQPYSQYFQTASTLLKLYSNSLPQHFEVNDNIGNSSYLFAPPFLR